jgi:hypothetical protein
LRALGAPAGELHGLDPARARSCNVSTPATASGLLDSAFVHGQFAGRHPEKSLAADYVNSLIADDDAIAASTPSAVLNRKPDLAAGSR